MDIHTGFARKNEQSDKKHEWSQSGHRKNIIFLKETSHKLNELRILYKQLKQSFEFQRKNERIKTNKSRNI